jgi:hypothetical protein
MRVESSIRFPLHGKSAAASCRLKIDFFGIISLKSRHRGV